MWRRILHIFFSILLVYPCTVQAGGRSIVTKTYNVNGVCEQCKTRIENAAYIKGVKYAEWSVDTHVLTLRFDSTKTTGDDVLRIIAKAGHDAGSFTSTPEDYDNLPACCHYRTVKKHER